MAFEYVGIDEAIERRGLRMVVVGGVPSGWGEAAKGICHVAGLDWVAVRLCYDSDALLAWAGELSGPVAVYERERPRAGWASILQLAERLAPSVALLPRDPDDRAGALRLAHAICGEAGLGWARRLQLVHAGLEGTGGFAPSVATYLGKKYGYDRASGALWGRRVASRLCMLGARLKAQRAAGSPYYVGDSMTAVDIYGAAFAAMFDPLSPDVCDMHPKVRAAFEQLDGETRAALDPIIVEHRDMMYARHLELPLSL